MVSILFHNFVVYCRTQLNDMHLSPARSMEGKIYYIAKSFRDERGNSTKKNVRRLGTLAEIREREGVSDAWAWAKTECHKETLRESEGRRVVTVRFLSDRRINKDGQRSFNIGYLTLNKLYYELGIDRIRSEERRVGKEC